MSIMKYTKKMRLIDVDDDVTQPNIDSKYQLHPSDYNFAAPRMLSILDNSMSEILNRRDMDDGEKWIHYNQTLQKFLNYMKKMRPPSTQHPPPEQQNQTIDAFDGHISENNITGVQPIRDSLEYISQPSVRDFFIQLRDNNSNTNNICQSSPIAATSTSSNQHSLMSIDDAHTTPRSRPQPQHSKIKTTKKKRAPKRNAANPMSNAQPTKKSSRNGLTPRALFRIRNPPLYWQATTAK